MKKARLTLQELIYVLFLRFFDIEPFRSRMRLLKGEAGIVEDRRPCGCILKGQHEPEKHLWTFTLDYSNCKQMKAFITDIMEIETKK